MQNFNIFLFNSLENSILNPLDQFDIRDLLSLNGFNLHISIANIGFYLIIELIFLLILNVLNTNVQIIIN